MQTILRLKKRKNGSSLKYTYIYCVCDSNRIQPATVYFRRRKVVNSGHFSIDILNAMTLM